MLLFGFITIKSFHFISSTEFSKTEASELPITNINSNSTLPPEYFAGKKIFARNCASCHHVFKQLSGPALSGVSERHPDKQLLFNWIRNSQRVLKSNNPYFQNLFIQYNKISMPAFPQLTDEDIQLILDYIQAEEKNPSRPAIAGL